MERMLRPVPIVTANGLRRVYGDHRVLDGVDVSVHEGERVGLVGVNGSGKSTLARILAGAELPDEGTVAHRRDRSVRYLAQEPSFEGHPSARDAVLEGLAAWKEALERHERLSEALGRGDGDLEDLLQRQGDAAADVERLGGWDLGHRAEAVMSHVGVAHPEQTVDTMSGGERRRVALARILVARPDLAILDEPTNHLDIGAIEWLERHLASDFPGAVLLITHDRYLLDRVVTRTVEIDLGTVYSYDGGWSAYLESKAERLAHEARTEANRQRFLRRELEWLRRQPKARTGKQKARVDRAEAAQQARAPKREELGSLRLEASRSGRTVVDFHDVSLTVGGRTLVEGFELALTKNERVGIVGPNGAGKTTLLRAVVGEVTPSAGEIVLGKNTRVAYLAQSRASLEEDATIRENVAGKRKEVEYGGRVMDIRTYLDLFLFDRRRVEQPVRALSGGERARVALARLLLAPANLLLLDEPTNDLDVHTLGSLEEMIASFDGAVLVVTHDRHFLDRVATSILAFEGEGQVVRYAGDYSTYRVLEERQLADAPEASAQAGPASASDARDGASKPKRASKDGLTYAERKELDGLMETIEAAEAEIARLEGELSDPAVYADRAEDVKGLVATLEAERERVETLLSRWEELESKKEAARS